MLATDNQVQHYKILPGQVYGTGICSCFVCEKLIGGKQVSPSEPTPIRGAKPGRGDHLLRCRTNAQPSPSASDPSSRGRLRFDW